MLRRWVLLLLSLQVFGLKAQNYPVQATVALAPPYTPQLSAYAAEPGRLTLTLLNKDFLTPQVEVYLSLRLEGPGITLQTRNGYRSPAVFTLQAGLPLSVSGTDIADLLDPANLDFQGLNKNSFIRGGQILPEGLWKWTVTAYNTTRGLQVSNAAFTLAALFKHRPPLLNLPADGARISSELPQFVPFQWTPRHTISPGLAGQVRYRLRLVELIPADRNPNEALQSTLQPFFETYTDEPWYTFGPADPLLIPGRGYAWQVQAIDVSGADLFENNGFSQVHAFVYGKQCPAPEGLTAAADPGRAFVATWDSLPGSMEGAWVLWYRPSGTLDWKTELVAANSIRVGGLLPKTNYEVQLTRLCESGESKPAGPVLVRTDSSAGAWSELAATQCGKPAPKFDLSNRMPLPGLAVGDRFTAADFTVTVLSAEGGAGIFSGSGTVLLPFTGKIPIPCTWQGVFINADRRMISGKITILRKPLTLSNVTISSLANRWRDLFGDNWNRANYREVKGRVSAVEATGDGRIRIGFDQGESFIPGGSNRVITDGSGQRWFISAGGAITGPVSGSEEPVVADERNGSGMPASVMAAGPVIHFNNAQGNRLAWDAYEFRAQTAGTQYDRLDGPPGGYMAPWKLLLAGEKENLRATMRAGLLKVHPDSIRFVRSDGSRIQALRLTDTTWQLQVEGRMHLWADAAWAVANVSINGSSGASRKVLGKINLLSVDARKPHVLLVPVNGQGSGTDQPMLQAALKQICESYGVLPTLSVHRGISVAGYSPDADKIRVSRQLLSADYGPELKRFVEAWQQQHAFPGRDTAVMFLLGPADDGSQGYMPLNHAYGFIFSGTSPPQAHTIAHETGHGLFALEHPFGEDESGAGRSLNLMDYRAPHALTNMSQWKRIHDPDEIRNFMQLARQSEDKGKLVSLGPQHLQGFRNPDSTFTCIDPAGFPIKLPAGTTEITFSNFDRLSLASEDEFVPRTLNLPFGSLVSFRTPSGTYVCQVSSEGTVLGYLNFETHRLYHHGSYKIDSATHLDGALTVLLEPTGSEFKTLAFRVKPQSSIWNTVNYRTTQPFVLGRPVVIALHDSEFLAKPARVAAIHALNGKVETYQETLQWQGHSSEDIYFEGKSYSLEGFVKHVLGKAPSLADQLSVFAYVNVAGDQLNVMRRCMSDMKWDGRELYDVLRRESVKDGFHTRALYYKTALEAFQNAAGLSNIFIRLQSMIRRSAPVEAYDSIFKSGNYTACVLGGLNSSDRITLINLLSEHRERWAFNSKNILLDALETCPQGDVEALYRRGFRANKYAWLRSVWEDEDVLEDWNLKRVFLKYLELFSGFEAAASDRRSFAAGLYMAESGLQSYQYPTGIKEFFLGLDEDREVFLHGHFVSGLGRGSYNSLLESGQVYFAQTVMHRTRSRFTATLSSAGADAGMGQWFEDVYSDTLWPLEPVNVLACVSADGIRNGEVTTLPAIWVHFLERQRIKAIEDREHAEAVGRVVQSVVAVVSVAAVPLSGGSSLALANAAVVCADMGIAQVDESIQQSWEGLSAADRGKYAVGYTAWKALKFAYDGTAVLSLARGGVAAMKSLVGAIRLNKAFSNFVYDGKAIYERIKSSRLSAPLNRMGARMERYVEWGRGSSRELLAQRKIWISNLKSQYDESEAFVPQGLNPGLIDATLKSQMMDGFSIALPNNLKEKFFNTLIQSGVTVPVKRTLAAGTELFKIVPKGNGYAKSSFYISKSEFETLKNGRDLEQKLGLPLQSHSAEYDVYKAVANQEIDVFESIVANTIQGEYRTTGGAVQTFLLDDSKWTIILEPKSLIPPK